MKLLNAQQIRELDEKTIEIQGIDSSDLMRRASKVFFKELMHHIKGRLQYVTIAAGSGNNGGDGVALASYLIPYFKGVRLLLCNIGPRSRDLKIMLSELDGKVAVHEINKDDALDFSLGDDLLIDAVFGSGLNREISGYWARLVTYLNDNAKYICSVDIPSGLYSDKLNETGNIIRSDWTLSFELPKLSFFFPENGIYLGKWTTASIGLDKEYLNKMETTSYVIDNDIVKEIFKKRERHSHKGTFGHAALITGSYGMSGASILSAKGCFRAGVGKLSCYVPEISLDLIQSQVPEAICAGNNGYQCIESISLAENYNAIGIGCGIGKNIVTKNALQVFLKKYPDKPLVIDADALNIIAQEGWLHLVPHGSLLTPHPGEFKRLFGDFSSSDKVFEVQLNKSKELNLYILLKGAYSRVACPNGEVFINNTGNPGMATAGSGDVLTGIITGILAQGYSMRDASILGVYMHGVAGDLAAKDKGEYGLIASDLFEYLPSAIKMIEKIKN